MLRAAAVLLLSIPLVLLSGGCSSRGSAPVYNRTPTADSVRVAPAQPPVQPPAQAPRERPPVYPRTYYLVQPGDTLYSIAWRQNLSYQQLAGWNGIRPPTYQIFPGQRLRLKPPESHHRPATHVRTLPPRAETPPPSPTVSVRPAPGPPPTAVAKPAVPSVRPPVHAPKPSTTTAKPAVPGPAAKNLKLDWDWPTNGKVVQTFSPGDDNRKGIWIHGQMGQPVSAAEAGKVVYAGNGLVGYGNLIIIKHDRSYLSAYGYNSKLLVKEGDMVKKGEKVAIMGTPNVGGQPVLHFEIRRQGKPVNPLPLLPSK